jgi:acyl-CoA synthetase (AMP-forming)/AMP-acid ligase II/NADP-dependent 3-hydroxy acid dehydrogenase YdfG
MTVKPSATAGSAGPDALARIRAAACAVPGVTDAAVVVRRRIRPEAGSPAAAAPRRGHLEGGAPPPGRGSAPPRRPAGGPPSIVSGRPYTPDASTPLTLFQALERTARQPGGRGTTYLRPDGTEDRQTYRQLLVDAARLLTGLRKSGLVPGDCVILQIEDSRNFVVTFWACLLGGFVPTPMGTAPVYRQDGAATRRLQQVWELLERPLVVTEQELYGRVRSLRTLWDTTALRLLTVEELRDGTATTDFHPAAPDDTALHLLTSGSSGAPKCVRHTHRSVVARCLVNAEANGFDSGDVTINWMPLDHVGGMPMHNLRDVLLGCEHVNARTESFIADPLRWLDWIEHYRATVTWAPNFAFSLINQRAEEIASRSWDLSSLRNISNGGEQVVPAVSHDFVRLLAPHGLRTDVMRPAWGMSETCGGVTHSVLRGDDDRTGVLTVDKRTLDGGTVAVLPAPVQGQPTFTLLGPPVSGTSLRIVDEAQQVVSQPSVGRLQVRGVTLMAGYHKADSEPFTEDGWFDTGDLAFLYQGQLVLTGRSKDQIVIRGANYPCHEIESVIEAVNGVSPTFAAACADHDTDSGTDRLIVFCVPVNDDRDSVRAVIGEVGSRIAREIGITPHRVVPLAADEFPRTDSGKIQRARLLTEYRAGAFEARLAETRDDGTDDDTDSAAPLFTTAWLPIPESNPEKQTESPDGTWLVVGDDRLAETLRGRRPADGGAVVSVLPGPRHIRLSDSSHRADLTDSDDLSALLAAVRADHGKVSTVVHRATEAQRDPSPTVSGALERHILPVHALITALGEGPVRLLVLTRGSFAVTADEMLDPAGATLQGLVRTANAEVGTRWVRQLDLGTADADPAGAVLREIQEAGPEDVVASRAGRRLLLGLRPAARPDPPAAIDIKPGGLYLMTGGFGRVGSVLAPYPLAAYGVTLVLTGRSPLRDGTEARLVEYAELGDATYRQADVADPGAVRAVIAEAEARSGRPIDGVLHLAGADVSSYWHSMESHVLTAEDPAEFRRMAHPKVAGTWVLGSALENRPDAALILFSSVNGHFGGRGFGAYAAASSFLPAFAAQWAARGRPVRCMSWSMWSGIGDEQGGLVATAARGRGFRALNPGEAIRLFLQALAAPHTHVLIGLDGANEHVAREIDPSALEAVDVTVAYCAPAAIAAHRVTDAVAAPAREARVQIRAMQVETLPRFASGALDETSLASLVGNAHARDRTAYQAPASDLERSLASHWEGVLRRPEVGRHDKFFELGGDSLTAVQLVDHINKSLPARLSTFHLYEHPTIAELALELGRTPVRAP